MYFYFSLVIMHMTDAKKYFRKLGGFQIWCLFGLRKYYETDELSGLVIFVLMCYRDKKNGLNYQLESVPVPRFPSAGLWGHEAFTFSVLRFLSDSERSLPPCQVVHVKRFELLRSGPIATGIILIHN